MVKLSLYSTYTTIPHPTLFFLLIPICSLYILYSSIIVLYTFHIVLLLFAMHFLWC